MIRREKLEKEMHWEESIRTGPGPMLSPCFPTR